MDNHRQLTRRQTSISIFVVGVLLSGFILWLTADWTRQVVVDDIRERSKNKLTLVVSTISAELRRYRPHPQLIAANEKLVPVLLGTASDEQLQALNVDLKRINDVAGASDVYLIRSDGETVAASNYQQEKTFIGQNFTYRPYFSLAMQGQQANYFALGSTSNKRGYFFSYPVKHQNQVIGVVALKITVDRLEEQWRDSSDEIIVVDDYGIAFLATDVDWQLKALSPLSEKDVSQLTESLQYGKETLQNMPVVGLTQDDEGRFRTLSIERGEIASDVRKYLVEQAEMASEGWKVLLLVKDEEVADRVQLAVVIAALVLASLLLAVINIVQRRRRLTDRMAMIDAHSLELEQKVKNRTKELTKTNELLEGEVAERKQAESALRETQAGLVQATKLAALGKMSAGVSHELNQPLAAIRSYSDNAKAFIERGNIDTASDNLQSITELADRMDRIIKNLRTYARDESISMRPVRVSEALDDSLLILADRIKDESIEVINEMTEPSPVVIAGDVRLQQVFVNIFSNAFDSMRNSEHKRLSISAHEQADTVSINVSDTGTGVPQALREHVFDPFYSTKSVGEGMGLGLSITYGIVDQFGGKIVIGDSPSGGATFSIILKKSQ